jgi:hypothetical protein
MVNKINMDFYGDKYYCICISYYICYINKIKYNYKAASELTFVSLICLTMAMYTILYLLVSMVNVLADRVKSKTMILVCVVSLLSTQH